MSIAQEIVNKVITGYERMASEKKRIFEELDLYNLRQSDLLHMIENDKKFDACKGYKYAKELQQVREKRRELKNELESLRILMEGYSKDKIMILTKISKEINQKDKLLEDLKATQNYENKTRIVDGVLEKIS